MIIGDTRSSERARQNYNRLARWYDLLAGIEQRLSLAGLEMLNVQPGETILEIGFGTGACLLRLASAAGRNGVVHGVDLSEGMYRITERKLHQAGRLKRQDQPASG